MEIKEKKPKEFIPALRFNFLTGIYDQVVRLTMPEKGFKSELIKNAEIKDHFFVLDFGCGTGTLTVFLKEKHPKSNIFGIDVDPEILSIAREKTATSNVDVHLLQYDGERLPFENEKFDIVVSSLVFHHLTESQKLNAFREIYRVLKPGGELHIADWGKAENHLMRIAFYLIQFLDGFSTTSQNVKGLIPDFIKSSGFDRVQIKKNYRTIFGTLSLFAAEKTN